ncbi:hypothetical protein [Lentzea sp. NPDC004782]|uniref:hypothetical protein n=1 Tax=Lentzea sp. NPDC004782 TaxID=3154458 RepID=UPI0033B72E51
MTPLHPTKSQSSETRRPQEIKVRCRDIVGRRRFIRVVLLQGSTIALIVPPGEVAVLNSDDVLHLRGALRQAVFVACDALDGGDYSHAATDLSFLSCTIPCEDAVGRQRTITVTATSGEPIMLIAPAGGVCVLQPLQTGSLRGALRDMRLVVLGGQAASLDVVQPESARREPERVVA